MQWLLVAAVAGGLFIVFAAVDWALTRLDSESEKHGRSAVFLGVGLVCLAGAGGLAWANRASSAPAAAPLVAKPTSLSLDDDVAQLEQLMDELLFLSQKVADGAYPSNLSAILTARNELQAARIALSRRPYPSTAASTLHSQSDIVLGAAYQTLGIQWALAKEGLWKGADRETATGPIKRELAKWYTIRDCLNSGAQDCGATSVTDPKHVAIRDFIGWFQPYLLELNRFQESDTDLMVGTPEELTRLRGLVSRARQELKSARNDSWDQRMVKATDAMLVAAETALAREATARATNSWNQDEMQRINAPVVAAFENMMTAIFEVR